MKDEIENFEARKPAVERVMRKRLVAWVGDARAAVGSTLWVGSVATRISRILPDHRVEAHVFDDDAIEVGDAVRHSPDHAAWPRPRPGRTRLAELEFETGAAPEPEARRLEAPPRTEALETGFEPIDAWTPLVRHGTNLILDVGASASRFDILVRSAVSGPFVAATNIPHELELDYEVVWEFAQDAPLARHVAVEWARTLDEDGVTLVLDAAVDIDLDALVDDAPGVTTFVRVAVDEDLQIIAETLDLGTSDAQIMLCADGMIDFARSTSSLGDEPHAQDFARVAELKERRALFGDEELDPADFELLERAELAERILIR